VGTGRTQGVWSKVAAGAPGKKSRFHDFFGQRVSLGRAVRNGPRALVTAVARVALGVRPERPWISYDGQALLDRHLTRESTVLEYGSGMSTIWLARRVGHLVSVECFAEWHRIVTERLPRDGATIDYRLATDRESYLDAPEGMEFDLILVDGKYRDECVERALDRLKPNGILYLDNSDHGKSEDSGDIPRAVALVEGAAKERGWLLDEILDFAPTNFFVQTALILQRPLDR
jgi:hypothetical protein